MSISKVQQEIIDTPGNMVVRASAGTGKTHTMVAKIAEDLKRNHTHKIIAAITFTVKAAKEIKDRLKSEVKDNFIGTNNSFAIEEVIKPFAKDVFGSGFKENISTDYSIRGEDFDECLSYLKNQQTICSYTDNKKNFVFELALEIIKNSKACRLFLKAKYFKIYIDEYQDCDYAMHQFFMYLCKQLDIHLFVVGDEKQSIYIWRGAYPQAFRSILDMPNFSKNKLRENYRSCRQIQNYSNLLNEDTQSLYSPELDNSAIILLKTTSKKWANQVYSLLNNEKSCALLRFKNDDAKTGAKELEQAGTHFTYVPKTPISEITTDVAWLYNAIAQYFILKKYSVYDLMNEIPEESIGDRLVTNYLTRMLKSIEYALKNENDEDVIREVIEIAKHFGYTTTSEKHIRDMIKTIREEEYHAAFYMDKLQNISITFHSSKGLVFDQVIIFAGDYGLEKEDDIYNHYVAVTRAKSKLIIVNITDYNAWRSDRFRNNLTAIFQRSGVLPQDLMTVIEM